MGNNDWNYVGHEAFALKGDLPLLQSPVIFPEYRKTRMSSSTFYWFSSASSCMATNLCLPSTTRAVPDSCKNVWQESLLVQLPEMCTSHYGSWKGNRDQTTSVVILVLLNRILKGKSLQSGLQDEHASHVKLVTAWRIPSLYQNLVSWSFARSHPSSWCIL